MPLSRLLFLMIGLSIILGLIIWLINSIYRLYIQVSFTVPILGNLLIFLIICQPCDLTKMLFFIEGCANSSMHRQ